MARELRPTSAIDCSRRSSRRSRPERVLVCTSCVATCNIWEAKLRARVNRVSQLTSRSSCRAPRNLVMKLRILIAEDERPARYALRKALACDEYEILEAEDGQEA